MCVDFLACCQAILDGAKNDSNMVQLADVEENMKKSVRKPFTCEVIVKERIQFKTRLVANYISLAWVNEWCNAQVVIIGTFADLGMSVI